MENEKPNLKPGDKVWVYFSPNCKLNPHSPFALANRHRETVLSEPFKLYGHSNDWLLNTTNYGVGKALYTIRVIEKIA